MTWARQLTLLGDPVSLAEIAPDPGADYGEIFTRRWIVDLILDLVGYTADRDLGTEVLIEPSCGTGAFLGPIVERLIESAAAHGRDLRTLGPAIRAFDLLDANAERARKTVAHQLSAGGLAEDQAETLAAEWVSSGDFLLHPHDLASADYVVGNPPYIRLENVPRPIMDAYRRTCPTMRGRADIYVGFIERGLEMLKPGGALSFICADRWMRNQYGADLREVITDRFAVDAVIAMHDVDAFEDEVSAYPAVVVLRNQEQKRAAVVEANGTFGAPDAERLSTWVRRGRRRNQSTDGYEATRVDGWFSGRDLWPAGSPSQLALIADLEKRFPPLEDARTGTRVGIGVATGCDEVFITRDPHLVEADRLLPLLQAPDTTGGAVDWSGTYLVNPWDDQGLVDLDRYPRMAAYLNAHRTRLEGRHIARQRPATWYRTIDRVHEGLTGRPKLVLPDMKAAAHPVLDDGGYYPHHNLYYVVSDAWDPEVLGGLLLSDIANLFVGAYCVRMRGGTYRFQAQYLRRIRVPDPRSVSRRSARSLARAFESRDHERATAAAAEAYGLPGLRLP
ncbi:Eco57I restriction-modification methylase domain-containing protein [Iamia sp.]|uniref:Eco57I restriction-modification methylase domain-containing protein n=1 Tax=Iamia sp. TaxID=2722710 RepID=UPI002C791B59|nr:N-6 DNA methylase [Iamia sp.]HXH58289.1 N-6 DNA methylase [Iamia sp.]